LLVTVVGVIIKILQSYNTFLPNHKVNFMEGPEQKQNVEQFSISVDEALQIAKNPEKITLSSREKLEIILKILEEEDFGYVTDKRRGYNYSQYTSCSAEVKRVEDRLKELTK
jgi:hypothetical protein